MKYFRPVLVSRIFFSGLLMSCSPEGVGQGLASLACPVYGMGDVSPTAPGLGIRDGWEPYPLCECASEAIRSFNSRAGQVPGFIHLLKVIKILLPNGIRLLPMAIRDAKSSAPLVVNAILGQDVSCAPGRLPAECPGLSPRKKTVCNESS